MNDKTINDVIREDFERKDNPLDTIARICLVIVFGSFAAWVLWILATGPIGRALVAAVLR
jgi:hypothetical protein